MGGEAFPARNVREIELLVWLHYDGVSLEKSKTHFMWSMLSFNKMHFITSFHFLDLSSPLSILGDQLQNKKYAVTWCIYIETKSYRREASEGKVDYLAHWRTQQCLLIMNICNNLTQYLGKECALYTKMTIWEYTHMCVWSKQTWLFMQTLQLGMSRHISSTSFQGLFPIWCSSKLT